MVIQVLKMPLEIDLMPRLKTLDRRRSRTRAIVEADPGERREAGVTRYS